MICAFFWLAISTVYSENSKLVLYRDSKVKIPLTILSQMFSTSILTRVALDLTAQIPVVLIRHLSSLLTHLLFLPNRERKVNLNQTIIRHALKINLKKHT